MLTTFIMIFLIDYLKKIYKLNDEEELFIRSLEERFNNVYRIKVNLKQIILKKLDLFYLNYEKFYKLFKNKENKELFLICSYGKEGIIKAARDLNIRVIEFQHGTMDKYHLGYSFEGFNNIPYFPDEFYLFGKFWADSTPLPLKKEFLKTKGFTNLNMKLSEYKILQKKKKILFISQWTINDILFEKAVETAKEYPLYEIVFRLHPSDNDKANVYKEHLKKLNLKNLKLSDINISILEELSDAEFVAGVYSTAIYEALVLRCKVIVLNMGGVEHIEYLIQQKYATLVELKEKIKLKNIDNKLIDVKYFFGDIND